MDIIGISTVRKQGDQGAVQKAFSFKNFGRIESAEILRAPFTVICGKNNSGKSYLAYMAWAYYNIQYEVLRLGPTSLSAPTWFKDAIKSIPDLPDKQSIKISRKDIQNHVNRWLGRNKDRFAKRLLNWDKASIGSFKLEVTHDLYISRSEYFPGEWKDNSQLNFHGWSFSFDEEIPASVDFSKCQWMGMPIGNETEMYDRLYLEVVTHAILGESSSAGATYIPASRSGLILSLGFIADSLFATLRGGKATQPHKFAAPIVSFLRSMVRPMGRSPERLSKIADFLEESVLQGSITRGEDERTTEFSYLPVGGKAPLPVYASSSMVTELTPVIETLRNGSLSGPLVLEEPEAHLHLGAQRQMARALVRASNQGVPIIVTTHSDTFLQQLNFLMMLSKNKNRAKLAKTLKYSSSEFLDPDNVVAYEICPKGKMSSVQKINIGEYGIVARSLSDVIMDMSHEVLEVME